MKISIFKFKNKIYNPYKINFKHNLWKIENDLNWIFKNLNNDVNVFNTKICLYWLDINLKNTFFPWILKIERELKSYFIHYYKVEFKNSSISHLLEKNNYSISQKEKNPYEIIIRKDLTNVSVDQLIFSLTFGEFVNLLISFSNFIKLKISKDLDMNLAVFVNLIKFLNILRNAVAHNKTVIKIKDEKNNKRFSLKKDLFDFEISKKEIDIISTNASGSIYALKVFLTKIDDKRKAKLFIKSVKKNFKTFQKTIKNSFEYERIMKLIFINYKKDIFKI
ncbi:MAG: Abi family protein [Malacoplasma sp.]|nr:Abi family protein [Malacoplasma sp.]